MIEHIPVGIYNDEVYIAEIEPNKPHIDKYGYMHFGVIRPVSKDMLENLRDPECRRGEYKDLWKEEVEADATEQGFDEWLEDVWAEEFDEDDEEDFPDKDSSDCQYLDEDYRPAADAFLAERDIEVGTWESSGAYSPHAFNRPFTGWDFIFDTPESKQLAKEYEESLKK